MSMLPEEAQFIADLRMKVLANQQQGLPPHTGLNREEVAAVVKLCRKEYTSNQAKSKASGTTSPSNAPAIDLNSLFTTQKSG